MSDIVFKIVMFVCFYMALPIMYGMLRNEAKPKKNLLIGATIPLWERDGKEVQNIVKKYKKDMDISFVVLTLLSLAMFFFNYTSVFFTFAMVWLVVAMIVPFAVYVKYRSKLIKLKKENGWNGYSMNKVAVDTKAAVGEIKILNMKWFIAPTVLSFIPVLLGIWDLIKSNGDIMGIVSISVCAAMFLTVLFCPLFYHFINRQKKDAINRDVNITNLLTRVRRYNQTKMWLVCAWLTALYNISVYIFMKLNYAGLGFIIASILYTILLMYFAIRCEMVVRKAQQKISETAVDEKYFDDDDKWIGGLFYYNPNDVHNVVNARIGIGTTMNMAKPAGKILMGFSVLCILAMPILGIWLMTEEFTPIKIETTENSIEVVHVVKEYEIPVDDIVSYDVTNDLPSMNKIIGSNMDKLYKGQFNVKGYGSCNVCLDPTGDEFLWITINDNDGEKIYIIGIDDKEVMENTLEFIAEAVK